MFFVPKPPVILHSLLIHTHVYQNKTHVQQSDVESNFTKMNLNPFDPFIQPITESKISSSIIYKQSKQPNHMKISGCRIIASSDPFLLESFKKLTP